MFFRTTKNKYETIVWQILNLSPLLRYPILLLLSLSILIVLSTLLLLFGQKPDSLIRGITESYKNGVSQLDVMYENVVCGEHFSCSVSANRHKHIVQPNRCGERHSIKIICSK